MTPIMQTIKKNWVYIFFFISLMIFIYSKFIRKEKDPGKVYFEMKTIQTSAGWGYEIYANDSLYIRQENIPAIEGKKSFETKEEASTIGNLALEKLKKGNIPQITTRDLDSCHIHK